MKIATIIPAFNEAKTIGTILNTLKRCSRIDQIIVVSDGSTDSTVEEALRVDNIEVIELLENRGKGGAIKAGLDHTSAEIILFLDADLIGLTPAHVNALLQPVIDGTRPWQSVSSKRQGGHGYRPKNGPVFIRAAGSAPGITRKYFRPRFVAFWRGSSAAPLRGGS